MTILANLTILVIELVLIAAASWFAFRHPLEFGALTAVLIIGLGWRLEWSRLRHEFPFYVNTTGSFNAVRATAFAVVASGETLVKAVLAAGVAVLTFSGSDSQRLQLLALAFAVITFVGTSTLRRLSHSFGVRPARWGYFRLVIPLGLLFSLSIQIFVVVGLIEVKSLGETATSIVFDLPPRPDLAQISEFLFDVKQTLDALVRAFLVRLLSDDALATAVGVVVSLNVLSGTVIAIYTVLIAEVVAWLERTLHRG